MKLVRLSGTVDYVDPDHIIAIHQQFSTVENLDIPVESSIVELDTGVHLIAEGSPLHVGAKLTEQTSLI